MNRSGSKARIGGRQLAFLSLAGVALLCLAFILGIAVGRQWDRGQPQGKKSAPTARGSLREAKAERTGQLQEKLTFYQTLTAPLGAAPSEASKPAAKPPAPPKPGTRLPEPPKISEAGSAPGPMKPSNDNQSATTKTSAIGGSAPPEGPAALASAPRPVWTVQVAAYRARSLAEELQRSLRAARHDAYVTAVASDDGRVHYRVRVGSFADRSQAERAAERLKSERSLVPFVTQK